MATSIRWSLLLSTNANGSTVTISNADYLAEEHAFIPKEASKTYTVPALAEYLTDPSLLPLETIKELVAKYLVDGKSEGGGGLTYSEPVHAGAYFSVNKEDGYIKYENLLEIFIAQDQYYHGEHRRTNYTPLRFYDITIEADGTVNLEYETGATSVFYTDLDQYLEDLEVDHDITVLEIN